MGQILLYFAAAVVATGIIWLGSARLERAAERLGSYHRLPPAVQGGVIAAVGSSFPELSATVLATLLHGEFDLGIAVIVGSAVFNITVIPGVAGLMGGRLSTDISLVYKDAQFYITSVIVLLLAFSFAVIYNPAEGQRVMGTMDRWIAAVPLILYGLYIFLQHQDVIEHRYMWDQLSEEMRDQINPLWEWSRLGVGLVLILVGVEVMIRVALSLGEALNTPPFLWGLTIVAVGTSLPDAFISIRAARQGRSTVSLANVLGSNIFDLLVAVPLGVMLAGSTVVDFSVTAPLMGVLTLVSIALFAMLRTELTLSRTECKALLTIYVLFLLWASLEKTGFIRFLFP